MSQLIHAIYTDDDVTLQAVKDTRGANYKIREVFAPFHIHGLDDALDYKPTRIAITSFLYALVGLGIATWMMDYMMIRDFPQNIGGKPSFSFVQNMPSFVVIMFELTVWFAGHFMVITFYLRSRLWPFKKPENPDPRTTDDLFLMQVEVGDNDIEALSKFLSETGAVEVNLINE